MLVLQEKDVVGWEPQEWMLDSGAASSTKTTSAGLARMRQARRGEFAPFADAQLGRADTTHVGHLTAHLEPSLRSTVLDYQRMRVTPAIKYNLLSIEDMVQRCGWKVVYSQKYGCKVTLPSGKEFIVPKKNGVRVLQLYTPVHGTTKALAMPSPHMEDQDKQAQRLISDMRAGQATGTRAKAVQHSGSVLDHKQGGRAPASPENVATTVNTAERQSGPALVTKWKAFLRLLNLHRRFGHIGVGKLKWLIKTQPGLGTFSDSEMEMFGHKLKSLCKDCAVGAHIHKSVPKANTSDPITHAAQRISCDVVGPWPPTRRGNTHVWVFVNWYSDMVTVVPVKRKSDYLSALKQCLIEQKLMKGHRLTLEQLRSDDGSEATSTAARAFYVNNGIDFKAAAPGMLQQNSKCESTIRRLLDNMRSEFSRAERQMKKQLRRYWDYLIEHVVDTRNGVTNSRIYPETPRQRQFGTVQDQAAKTPTLWFNAMAVKDRRLQRHKLDPNGRCGYFLGRSRYMQADVVLTESGSVIHAYSPVYFADTDTWSVDADTALAREPEIDHSAAEWLVPPRRHQTRGDEAAGIETAGTADHASTDSETHLSEPEESLNAESDSDSDVELADVRRMHERWRHLRRKGKNTKQFRRTRAQVKETTKTTGVDGDTGDGDGDTSEITSTPLTPLQQRAVDATPAPQYSSFNKQDSPNSTIHIKMDLDNADDQDALEKEAVHLGLDPHKSVSEIKADLRERYQEMVDSGSHREVNHDVVAYGGIGIDREAIDRVASHHQCVPALVLELLQDEVQEDTTASTVINLMQGRDGLEHADNEVALHAPKEQKLRVHRRWHEADPSLITLQVARSVDEVKRKAVWEEGPMQAMEKEMACLRENQVFSDVFMTDVDTCQSPLLNTMMLFSKKFGSKGELLRWKARFVAKGYMEEKNESYWEVYAPTTPDSHWRSVVALAASHKWPVLKQADFETAFLKPMLKQILHIRFPKGMRQSKVNPATGKEEELVYRLHRALYGLKGSPKAFSDLVAVEMKELGYHRCWYDASTYVKWQPKKGHRPTDKDACSGTNLIAGFPYSGRAMNLNTHDVLIVTSWVDDLLCAGSNTEMYQEMIERLNAKKYNLTEGDADFFVGIKIDYDRDAGIVTCTQQALIEKLAERFTWLPNTKPVPTPLPASIDFSKETQPPAGQEDKARIAEYRSAVGVANYVVTKTKPEAAVALSTLSKVMANPSKLHFKGLCHFLTYLYHARHEGLQLGGTHMQGAALYAFCDADYAGDVDSTKSRTGYCIYLNNSLVAWRSRAQGVVSRSTFQSELIAQSHAAAEVCHLRYWLEELGFLQDGPVMLRSDNQGSVDAANNPKQTPKLRHMRVAEAWIREASTDGRVTVQWLPGNQNPSDGFTKRLDRTLFNKYKVMLLRGIH